jgi:hypothetical protein
MASKEIRSLLNLDKPLFKEILYRQVPGMPRRTYRIMDTDLKPVLFTQDWPFCHAEPEWYFEPKLPKIRNPHIPLRVNGYTIPDQESYHFWCKKMRPVEVRTDLDKMDYETLLWFLLRQPMTVDDMNMMMRRILSIETLDCKYKIKDVTPLFYGPKLLAWSYLVELGEIDPEVIWNLKLGTYGNNVFGVDQDLGIRVRFGKATMYHQIVCTKRWSYWALEYGRNARYVRYRDPIEYELNFIY